MADIKTCAICLGNLETGKGQAIFTAECSHCFHFRCITDSITHGNYVCPVCRANWNDLPFIFPRFDPNLNNNNNTTDQGSSQNIPYVFSQDPLPQSHFPGPVFEPELVQFSDDEPLPANPTSSALQKVSIKAVPERPAIGASDPVSPFAVLVSLRAPSLSEDAQQSQRAPIDLVTVLDISGSMHGPKLALLKLAVNFVIDNLSPFDRLSVVSFSSHVS